MGRNAAIKRFDATETGETMDLLASKEGRLPVILELLKSTVDHACLRARP